MASFLFHSFTSFHPCCSLYSWLGCSNRCFHQASMNGNIFRDAENENGGMLARQHCWRDEEDTNRQDWEKGRESVSLVEVVFPQGKHEHILARGLFRQIGDCCGGERKGSSPSLSPPPASSPPLPSVAHCLRHQHTALRATNTLCLPSAQ